MKQIAFVSYSPPEGQFDFHYEDEHTLKAPLARRNVHVQSVAWDNPSADWGSYDALILRSTWDYHHRFQEFNTWLESQIAQGCRLYNAPSILRWNMNKTYLEQLAQEGVKILPTRFVAQGEIVDLHETLLSHQWREAVIKPVISAGGDNTWRVTLDQAIAKQSLLDAQVLQGGVMIQQFATQIAQGEFSFLFFNGQFSHTTRKIPAEGDMFVHEHRGGKTYPYPSESYLIAQASNIIRLASKLTGEMPLYARVDGVIDAGTLILMELELVEPYLYFPYADSYAPERFADAIVQRLEQQS